MTREEIERVRCGHTEVTWRDKGGVECSGLIVGHSLDGFQVMTDGRIRDVKPSEATLVETPSVQQHVAPGPQVQQPGTLGRSTSAVPQVPREPNQFSWPLG